MQAIETKSLRVVYRPGLLGRPHAALEGLDLEVGEGEVFGYLGPNGAGKTTTLKCLTGLLRPTAGEASIFGVSVGETSCRRGIGFLPEDPYFYEYLTAREFMDFSGRLSGLPQEERAKRTGELLERVGLAGSGDTRLREFSKGMRQRIGLAQAFIHGPRLAILDEPMSGLDPVGRREVREFIQQARDGGTTVFFSSHILADVEALCDTVGILHKGRLMASGALTEIISPRVVSIKAGVKGLGEKDIEGMEVSAVHRDGEVVTFSMPGDADTERLLNLVRSKGGRLISLQPEREDLESAFVRLTGSGEGGGGAAGEEAGDA